MKNVPYLILFLILIIIGCQTESYFIGEPDPQEAKIVADIGSKVSQQLLDTLKMTLTKTIKDKGPVEAIKVCQIEALPMTAAISKLADHDIEIKRTSLRIRNPKNSPNRAENLALNKFEQNKEAPEYYIHKITEENETYFYFYQPLKTAGLCLMCHGNPETMDSGILNTLRKLYPQDQAIGYEVGDSRGLIRVKVKI